MSNIIAGNPWNKNLGKAMFLGATTGAITGLIGGAYQGYRNAKAIGADPWSGRKITNVQNYSSSVYYDSPPQINNEEGCVYACSEYVDKHYGGHSANDFAALNNNLPGADPTNLWGEKVPYDYVQGVDRLQGNINWDNLGFNLQNNKYFHIIAVIGDENPGHAVVIKAISTGDKNNLFFGGTKHVLLHYDYWDPIGASYIINSTKTIQQITPIGINPNKVPFIKFPIR